MAEGKAADAVQTLKHGFLVLVAVLQLVLNVPTVDPVNEFRLLSACSVNAQLA